MKQRRAATLTIGQAPRADITPILQTHWPSQANCVHKGLLDGLSPAEIATRFAPQPGDALLTTRLLGGTSVLLGKSAVQRALQEAISTLEAGGCEMILLLCTGEFEALKCEKAWLVEPDRVLPQVIAAMTQSRQAGIVVPLAPQAQTEARKWEALGCTPIYEFATPYEEDLERLARAAKALKSRGAEVLILDCMGYTERHRACASEATDLPVLLPNSIMARLVAEMI
jgi:protein AroM